MHLVKVVDALSRERVLNAAPARSQLLAMTKKCTSCESNGPHGRCLGWSTEVPLKQAFSLGPFSDRSKVFQVRVAARLDFERHRAMSSTEWETWPLEHANVTVSLVEVGSDLLIRRQHFDLANLDQEGPVWHLQIGGTGSGEGKMDLPRWITPPMDLALTLDLLVYTYSRAKWKRLQMMAGYRRAILTSEALVQRSWIGKFSSEVDRPSNNRSQTLLRIMDNASEPDWPSVWNPRPSSAP